MLADAAFAFVQDTMARLFTSLSILRNRHGCTLPVEIFAFPEEMTEQPGQGLRGRIEALGGVTFRELHSSAKLKLWKVLNPSLPLMHLQSGR